MKQPLLFVTLTAAATLHAQVPAPTAVAPPVPASAVEAEAPKPALTPDQVSNVLKQLADLEKTILQQRATNLGGLVQKIRTAASSDASAVNFVEDCDTLVNVERKDGDKDEAVKIKQRAEQVKRGDTKQQEDKEGDYLTSLRLTLEFLALSLEAHEAKDLSSMIPKVQSFHQSLIENAKKLKGRAGDMLMMPISRGGFGGGARRPGGNLDVGVVIEAYQLAPYLRTEGWPVEPANIMGMYDKVILKVVRETRATELASAWDGAINTEVNYRKERLPEGELTVWQQQEYPNLRWLRAKDLVRNSGNPVNGMAEMLKVIKEYPNHASSPAWVVELRNMVSNAQPAPASAATSP